MDIDFTDSNAQIIENTHHEREPSENRETRHLESGHSNQTSRFIENTKSVRKLQTIQTVLRQRAACGEHQLFAQLRLLSHVERGARCIFDNTQLENSATEKEFPNLSKTSTNSRRTEEAKPNQKIRKYQVKGF